MYSWYSSGAFLFSLCEQTNHLSHMPTRVEDVGHSATYLIFFQMCSCKAILDLLVYGTQAQKGLKLCHIPFKIQ